MYVTGRERCRRGRIAGVGTALPRRVVTSADIEEQIREAGVDIPVGFIERVTGIRSRRRIGEGENASDLAAAATRRALAAAGLEPADVDVLIFASASHDVTEPATANIVQTKVGATNAVVFDVKNACNSLLSALDLADAYIQLGRAKAVVLASGEVPSLVIDPRIASRADLSARFSHLTMGDAGGALLLVPSEDVGIQATAAVSRGSAWDLGTVLSFGTMYPHDTSADHAQLRTRSGELEERARADMPDVMNAALEGAGWAPDSVDVVACHQHSRRLAHAIVEAVGIPRDRVALPLRYAGNAASANIPLALAHAERTGKLFPGARILMCGGSAGFSAIASAVSW
jgi:3-oxoacyl-(acyl-carrier-protein) synthase III